MKTIYTKEEFPQTKLVEFYDSLNEEKDFFHYTFEDLLESEVLIYEEKEGKIAGIAGFRQFKGIPRSLMKLPVAYVAVLKEFQGQSLGGELFSARYREGSKIHDYLINTTSPKNIKMLNLMKKLDYKILAETRDRIYFFKAFNTKGNHMYPFIKLGIWLYLSIRKLFSRFISSSSEPT
jgi:GNAT superfamily N-acetyltransferase